MPSRNEARPADVWINTSADGSGTPLQPLSDSLGHQGVLVAN